MNGYYYKSKNNKEESKDFNSCYYEGKNFVLKSVPTNDQYSSVSNTLRNETINNGTEKCCKTVNLSINGKSYRNNNVSFSDDEATTSGDIGVTTSQQSMIPLIENIITSRISKDPETQCGFCSTCLTPRIQSFATKKSFLLFFCIALVLQGMYYTYFASVLTTIEKLFQIRSQTTGIIMSSSEAGQIIGGLILPYYGNRGNRPKWIAGGIVAFSIGTLLSATPQLFLNDNDLTKSFTMSINSSDANVANTCSYTSQNTFLNISDNLNLNCKKERTSAIAILSIFFLSLLAVGIGHTTVQNLGFPYLDDNVDAEESPSYFGITIGVRIFGPTLGFIFGSFCMRFYINPLQTVDFQPTDPRWIGAWWLGIIFISMALFSISIMIVLFPKRLPNETPKKYYTVKVNEEHKISCLSTSQNGNYCYNQTSPSTILYPSKKEYTYIEPEDVISKKSGLCEDDSKTISIHYINNSYPNKENIDSKGSPKPSICYQILTKISLCLPRRLMKPLNAKELKLDRNQQKRCKSDFWSTVTRLLKNKVLLLRTASSVLHLLPIAGLYTFLPKYLETQFNLTVHSAAMISGVGGILVMGVGIAASGYVIRKLKLSPTKVASWIAITALLYSIGMFILMFVGCPKENYGIYNESGQPSLCKTSCQNCDLSLFSPICASDGNSYYSACQSGCSTVEEFNTTNGLMFSNCDCLPAGVTAKLGRCDSNCQNIIIYISIFCIFVFIHSTSEVGAMMLTMRCVEPTDKAMALGLVSAAVGLFGNVPCPIIYGSVIDYSCLVWKVSCEGQGACQLYNTDHFRYYFHGTTGAIMLLAFIVDVFVVRCSKKVKFDDTTSIEKSKNHNSS